MVNILICGRRDFKQHPWELSQIQTKKKTKETQIIYMCYGYTLSARHSTRRKARELSIKKLLFKSPYAKK